MQKVMEYHSLDPPGGRARIERGVPTTREDREETGRGSCTGGQAYCVIWIHLYRTEQVDEVQQSLQ